MKNTIVILLLSLLFTSCQQQITQSDISKINGYWEIEKVIFDKGKEKEYPINQTYDFFEITKNKGFRKKVMPQLDGTFEVDNTYENIRIAFKKDKVYINYATPYAKWTEELVAISDKELVLINSDKTEYHYKKAQSINILGDGKKTE